MFVEWLGVCDLKYRLGCLDLMMMDDEVTVVSLKMLNAAVPFRLQAGTTWLNAKLSKVFFPVTSKILLHKNNKISLPFCRSSAEGLEVTLGGQHYQWTHYIFSCRWHWYCGARTWFEVGECMLNSTVRKWTRYEIHASWCWRWMLYFTWISHVGTPYWKFVLLHTVKPEVERGRRNR
jgi:hypothetical protein